MLVKNRAKQALPRLAFWVVEPLLDFLQHDVALALKLSGVEAGVLQSVGQDVEASIEKPTGQNQVVHGFVVAGPGVDLATRALHFPRDLTHAAPLGPLEQHVLEHMRDAGQFLGLVG